MSIKSLIEKNSVTYFTDFQGARIIVMQARFESRSDLPRLYKLAQERSDEIKAFIVAQQNQQQAA